eukprot:CAMPEP_0196717604 /NCGR_PEP_ID=MMETSP1091-20130531/968_1 /TAXON_ID=302021 /ORGANISM="Rhodomonas sp., Strain CCMP768" /LENGTH=164 /DNA_ID=CAMNT_0042058007 /DNA_START=291 /DNA_END=785 /DNA_ORIENTATION=-
MLTSAVRDTAPHELMRFHEPAAPKDQFNSFAPVHGDQSLSQHVGVDDFDEWSDDEDDSIDCTWAEQFQQYLLEDAERARRKCEERRAEAEQAAAAAAKALEESRRAEEEQRLCEPLSKHLGSVTYKTRDGEHVAFFTASGYLDFEGERFACIGKWLEHSFGKRI